MLSLSMVRGELYFFAKIHMFAEAGMEESVRQGKEKQRKGGRQKKVRQKTRREKRLWFFR